MHKRSRHIEKVFQKRAKMFAVLGLLGPRQVGKSTFLKSQWQALNQAVYLTFDQHEVAQRAKRAPWQLLKSATDEERVSLIIDEAQKVPHIFDSIKAMVDDNRRMGAFTLSGSVEFSSKSGVRESLAGRMGISRLYPMTLRELADLPFHSPWVDLNFQAAKTINSRSIDKWLTRGGMPIFCSFADTDERANVIHDWLEAICFRDLNQLKDHKYDGEVAFNLLKFLAHHAKPTVNQCSTTLGVSAHALKKYLSALESLFLIYSLPSISNARAKRKYLLFDSGVRNALLPAAVDSDEQCKQNLQILVLNEIYAQYEYAGKLKPSIAYYRTRGGAELDLVLSSKEHMLGIECLASVDVHTYQQRAMQSFLKQYPAAYGYFIAPIAEGYQLDDRMWVLPWHAIA